MRKKFNITGSCNPERHYMVDTPARFVAVESLIDGADYFTINRARQYGKTTTLHMIWRKLSGKYLVVDTSFEGVGDNAFEKEDSFVKLFARLMVKELPAATEYDVFRSFWKDVEKKDGDLDALARSITFFCQSSPKPVVLLIDEVDQSSNNQLFVRFIGMLRDLYLQRDKNGMDSTFHSVILAGVYDVKNLKLKLRADEEHKYNSPWNIAADFNVDMTFHPDEIAQMLGSEEFILELKIWHGDKYEQNGRDQLSDYLNFRGKDQGYLLTFDFSKNKVEKEPEWIKVNGKRIYEVVV